MQFSVNFFFYFCCVFLSVDSNTFKWHGLCETMSGHVNSPKTLGQCDGDFGAAFGQSGD